MELSKSIAWVAFVAIIGVTGVGKDNNNPDRPAAKPADTTRAKTQVAQRESHTKVATVRQGSERPVQIVRTSAP